MRRITTAALVLLPLIAALPACGGGQSGSPTPRRDSRALAPYEIQEAMNQNVMNLYDLIATRKPNWLRPTITSAPTSSSSTATARTVAVWMDGVRLGGPEQLRTVALSVVVAARYLTPSEAQAQLGLNNLGGAIIITTQR